MISISRSTVDECEFVSRSETWSRRSFGKPGFSAFSIELAIIERDKPHELQWSIGRLVDHRKVETMNLMVVHPTRTLQSVGVDAGQPLADSLDEHETNENRRFHELKLPLFLQVLDVQSAVSPNIIHVSRIIPSLLKLP